MNLKDLTTSIKQKLVNYAKKHNLVYQNVATAFLLERLAVRLTSNSQLYKSLVFKGGYVGLRVYNSSRYTIDLDALLIKSNLATALEIIINSAEKDLNDGVWFNFQEQIDLKTQGEYGGIRQVYRAGIGEPPREMKKAQIINFDLGIGDPIVPHPIENKVEELIGDQKLSWMVYPIETIIAEKIHVLVDRGEFNSRSKDILDLTFFLPKANKENLVKSIDACFRFRRTPLPDDLIANLSSIDLNLLKKGWSSAVSGLKEAPKIEEAYQKILDELKRKLDDKNI